MILPSRWSGTSRAPAAPGPLGWLVAACPTAPSPFALARAADAGSYQAKRGGKNQVAAAVVHAQLGEVAPGEVPVEVASVA